MSARRADVACGALLATLLSLSSAAADHPDKALVERGKQTYEQWCTPCHGPGPGSRGPLLPGTYGLQIKYRGTKPALLEDRNDLPEPVLRIFVRRGAWSMPGFRKTEVTDEQIAAIAAYLKERSKKPRSVVGTGAP